MYTPPAADAGAPSATTTMTTGGSAPAVMMERNVALTVRCLQAGSPVLLQPALLDWTQLAHNCTAGSAAAARRTDTSSCSHAAALQDCCGMALLALPLQAPGTAARSCSTPQCCSTLCCVHSWSGTRCHEAYLAKADASSLPSWLDQRLTSSSSSSPRHTATAHRACVAGAGTGTGMGAGTTSTAAGPASEVDGDGTSAASTAPCRSLLTALAFALHARAPVHAWVSPRHVCALAISSVWGNSQA